MNHKGQYKTGYIINSKDYSNTSSIITIFSQDCIKTAIVKGGRSKLKMSSCQIANKVSFCHFGKEESLGIFAIEPIAKPLSINIENANIIISLFAACELVYNLISESFGEYNQVYKVFEEFIFTACSTNKHMHDIIAGFCTLESIIMQNCGFFNNSQNKKCIKSSYQNLLQCLKNIDVCSSRFLARSQLNQIIF